VAKDAKRLETGEEYNSSLQTHDNPLWKRTTKETIFKREEDTMTGRVVGKFMLLMLFSSLPSTLMVLHIRHGLSIGMVCWLAYIVAVNLWSETLGKSAERKALIRWSKERIYAR
jgi:hypothetical protein